MSESRNDSERLTASTGNTMMYMLGPLDRVPIAERLCRPHDQSAFHTRAFEQLVVRKEGRAQ
jgi:hypothetical protein